MPKNDFTRKMKDFDAFTKISYKYWPFGHNNYYHSLWKVAQSAINRPIWSHCSNISSILKHTFRHNVFRRTRWNKNVRVNVPFWIKINLLLAIKLIKYRNWKENSNQNLFGYLNPGSLVSGVSYRLRCLNACSYK